MKTLKFTSHLVPLVLSGEKTSTWRMFDDKGLEVGDELQLIEKETGKEFAKAKIIHVREKMLRDLDETEYMQKGEEFQSLEERLFIWKKYYGDAVTLDTLVKMVDFKLI